MEDYIGKFTEKETMEKKAVLFVVKFTDPEGLYIGGSFIERESFLKIGYTEHSVYKRFRYGYQRYKIEILKEIEGELSYIKELKRDIHIQLIKYCYDPHDVDKENFTLDSIDKIDYKVALIRTGKIDELIDKNIRNIEYHQLINGDKHPKQNAYSLFKPEFFTIITQVSILIRDSYKNSKLVDKCKDLKYLLNYVPTRLIKLIDEEKAFISGSLNGEFYIYVLLDNPHNRQILNSKYISDEHYGIDENGRIY